MLAIPASEQTTQTKMKILNVTIGIEYQKDGELFQTTCLNRNGFTIGTRHYVNGKCYAQKIIDGLPLDDRNYFVTESADVLRLKSQIQPFGA